ncbi:hypothetical protein BJX65DRAFT_277380 [Aspergillus insuetus]
MSSSACRAVRRRRPPVGEVTWWGGCSAVWSIDHVISEECFFGGMYSRSEVRLQIQRLFGTGIPSESGQQR